MEPLSSAVKANDQSVFDIETAMKPASASKRIGTGRAKMGRVDHPDYINPGFFRQAAGQLHCRIPAA